MRLRTLTIVVLSIPFFPAQVLGQTIILNSPTVDQIILEGEDFATVMLRNPWDFEERRDIGWEENYDPNTVQVLNGEWSGQKLDEPNLSPNNASTVYPLYPGLSHGALSDPLPGDRSRPRLGYNNRVDTSRFTHLAFRMNQSNRSDIHVSWNDDELSDPLFPDPTSPSIEVFDGFRSVGFDIPKLGWNVYNFDLTNPATYAQNFQGTWSGQVLALRLEPSVGATNGDVTEFDWIRLVDPNSGPQINVNWTATGLGSSEVIVVSLDDDGVGYDGDPIAYFPDGVDPGNFSFPSAILPPGTYHIYVEVYGGSSTGLYGPLAQSGYSGAINITEKPIVEVMSPSEQSGVTYPTTSTNLVWDMAQAEDVLNLNSSVYSSSYRNFTGSQIVSSTEAMEGGSVFQAITQTDTLSEHGFPQVHLQTDNFDLIDPGHYRYVTYRVRGDDVQHPTLRDKVADKWFSSIVYWNTSLSDSDAGKTNDQFVFEGWHTYTVDLWDLSRTDGVPWRAFHRLGNLATIPLETQVPTQFEIDFVRLTAENRPNPQGQYLVEFSIHDADSSALTARVYYDNDDFGFDGTLITTATGLVPGQHQVLWDMSNLPVGHAYYVYVEVQDSTGNVHASYSSVPVVTGGHTTSHIDVPYDYDNDGKSDPAVFRASNGSFYIDWSSIPGGVRIPWITGAQFYPISGDFDGDGETDLGLAWEYFGYIVWYIFKSDTGEVYPRIWGLATDQIAIGDYNGNGMDEIAVYRDGTWFILEEDDKVVVRMWGLPGDKAVPHDYDGDNVDDLAVFRPSDGMWWIVKSSTVGGASASEIVSQQFGLPGDIPVASYWNSDEYADLGVYRPSLGMWFLMDLQNQQSVMYQWGLPGDIPVIGDYNGDGESDLTVYRPSDSSWCHNFRNFHYEFRNWGNSSDKLPQTMSLQ